MQKWEERRSRAGARLVLARSGRLLKLMWTLVP
jgi:hypothetical protein